MALPSPYWRIDAAVVSFPETVASISQKNGLIDDSAYMVYDDADYGEAAHAAGALNVLRQLDYDMTHCRRLNTIP